MSTAGKKRGRPPKGKASEQEEERNEEVITPQRMSLTVRTYKSPKSSQESASPSSQSKSKSPAKASSKHSKNSSPPPPSPIRTPPRTVSPSTGSRRVGRRKSLEAKNKPREEPISPSMPPPPPEEPATSEAILPPKEMEELKKQFEDIDKYELVEETVHVPPKVNKYDEQTGNSASNKGATNKTPKGSLKKSNKHTDEDGYESPYSPPHANTPRVLITPKSLVKTPSSRPTSAYSTPASHSKPKPILPPTPNSSIPTPTKHTPKPKPLIPTSPASSSSSKPKPATSSAKKHATSPAKPAPVQAESETETETETNSKPVAKKVGAKKAGRPKKETQDAKPKKETEDPKPKKGAAKTKKETEDAKPKKETNAKKVAGRKRAVEESDDDQLRRSKRLQK